MSWLLRRLRNRSTARRLHVRAKADTYPRSYVELCKALLGFGDAVRAMDTAREGLERFPHSEDLRDVLRHTWRQTKADEIEALRKRCAQEGEVRHFQDLANIYLECEEYDEALAVAEELARRLPDSMDGWLLQGQVLLKRFYKDHVASDARRGIVHLKRVIELDEKCFTAHYLLTQIYHHIGAISKALFHLYRALDIEPEHEGATNLYGILIDLPLEREEESVLLRDVEENEQVFLKTGEEDEGAGLPARSQTAVLADLNRLSLLNGVMRAAFVSRDVTMVAERGECRMMEDGETDPLCEIARGFRRAASISSKRMGIGAFQSSVLFAGTHMLQFHAVGQTVVLVESDDAARADIIKAECTNFVASCLGRKGVVHA